MSNATTETKDARDFDPYHQWLGIPPREQPPDHYRLLGLERFESASSVIANAADRQMAHLHHYESGEYAREAETILSELARARICLLSPERKKAYDEQLQRENETTVSVFRDDSKIAFDPYHQWLGIRLEQQPTDHYRLLGVAQFETDPDVLANAADRQISHLQSRQPRENAAQHRRILAELNAARSCLLNPTQKVAYDLQLKEELDAKQVVKPPLRAKTEQRESAASVSQQQSPPPLPASRSSTMWMEDDVLMCKCPNCQSAMTVRIWLMTADCWQCGISLELNAEQEREAKRLLQQRENNRSNVDAKQSESSPNLPEVERSQQSSQLLATKVARDTSEKLATQEKTAAPHSSLHGLLANLAGNRKRHLYGFLALLASLLLVGISGSFLWKFASNSPELEEPQIFNSSVASKADAKDKQPAVMEKIITNSIGMKLALIPAGEFMMGSPDSEKDRSSSETQHHVRITQPYYLATTEVTQKEWVTLMGTRPWSKKRYVKEGDNYAAAYVSWEDAVEFCRKLSAKEAVRYRLPTEAEWEYACRTGSSTRFSFGDDQSKMSDYGWWGAFVRNGNVKRDRYPHEVAKKRPNAWGLYDMHGNVSEWCADWWDQDYYKNSPVDNPSGPGTGSSRVHRGGGWSFNAEYCRSRFRGARPLRDRPDFMGLRVAADLPTSGASRPID